MKRILVLIGALFLSFQVQAEQEGFFRCNQTDANQIAHNKILRSGELLIQSADDFRQFDIKFTYDNDYLFSVAYSCVFSGAEPEQIFKAVSSIVNSLGTTRAKQLFVYELNLKGSNLPKLPVAVKRVFQERNARTGDEVGLYKQSMESIIRKNEFRMIDAVKFLIMSAYKQEAIEVEVR